MVPVPTPSHHHPTHGWWGGPQTGLPAPSLSTRIPDTVLLPRLLPASHFFSSFFLPLPPPLSLLSDPSSTLLLFSTICQKQLVSLVSWLIYLAPASPTLGCELCEASRPPVHQHGPWQGPVPLLAPSRYSLFDGAHAHLGEGVCDSLMETVEETF